MAYYWFDFWIPNPDHALSSLFWDRYIVHVSFVLAEPLPAVGANQYSKWSEVCTSLCYLIWRISTSSRIIFSNSSFSWEGLPSSTTTIRDSPHFFWIYSLIRRTSASSICRYLKYKYIFSMYVDMYPLCTYIWCMYSKHNTLLSITWTIGLWKG